MDHLHPSSWSCMEDTSWHSKTQQMHYMCNAIWQALIPHRCSFQQRDWWGFSAVNIHMGLLGQWHQISLSRFFLLPAIPKDEETYPKPVSSTWLMTNWASSLAVRNWPVGKSPLPFCDLYSAGFSSRQLTSSFVRPCNMCFLMVSFWMLHSLSCLTSMQAVHDKQWVCTIMSHGLQ